MDANTYLRQAAETENEYRKSIWGMVGKLSEEPDCAKRIDALLDAAVEFFRADRAYVIEGDTELVTAVNTHERCAPGMEYQQDTLKDMPVEAYMRWLDVFQRNEAVVIEDMEVMKESCPGEYKYFNDSDVHSIIVVPFTKRINHGFVGVDNPKQNCTDAMTLRILAYAIALELNEIKLTQENAALLSVSKYPENIVHVHLLDGLKVSARGGTLSQKDFTIQGHALFAILLLNPEKQFGIDDLFDIVSPTKETGNPSVVVANAVYRLRKCLDIIGLKELIIGDHGRYLLNPAFQIETDVSRFRQFALAMRNAQTKDEKLGYGEEALSLYVNPLPQAICNDIRFVLEESELECIFLEVTKVCASIYMEQHEYRKALQVVLNALRNNPMETDLMLYRVRLMKKSKISGLKSYVHKVRPHLDENELEELNKILKEKD